MRPGGFWHSTGVVGRGREPERGARADPSRESHASRIGWRRPAGHRYKYAHPVVALAQEWPQFRGPDGQGHSTERSLPIEWSDTRNVAWKVAVPGRGWSSPVVGGGRVWLTTATTIGRDTSLRLMAYDIATGQPALDVEVSASAASRSSTRRTATRRLPPLSKGSRSTCTSAPKARPRSRLPATSGGRYITGKSLNTATADPSCSTATC